MSKLDKIKSRSIDAEGKVWHGEAGKRLFERKKEITDFCQRNGREHPKDTPYLFQGYKK